MPVTQFIRCSVAALTGGGTGGDVVDLLAGESATSGVVTLATSNASKLGTALYARAEDNNLNDDMARLIIPNARVTGIEFRVGCILRGIGGGALLDNNTTNEVEFYFSKFAVESPPDYIIPNTSDYSPANDAFRLIATKNATDLAATYVGSGTTNDPRNYPTLLGGEGELFGLEKNTNLGSFYALGNWGLQIKRGQGQGSYEVAVGGDIYSNDNPMPAVRYYYEYPKIYINTGKVKLTDGKINMGY